MYVLYATSWGKGSPPGPVALWLSSQSMITEGYALPLANGGKYLVEKLIIICHAAIDGIEGRYLHLIHCTYDHKKFRIYLRYFLRSAKNIANICGSHIFLPFILRYFCGIFGAPQKILHIFAVFLALRKNIANI